ncbi:MAG: Fpg/Nei family DNA glycosylase [Acidimicrobiales bacterium]
MPEGDTIHRSAARLRSRLAGRTVAAFRAPRLVESGPAAGTEILDVQARGKFLLVHFADGSTLETHMKMTGSWHIYRRGERWRRSRSSARAVIETDHGWVAVCFAAPHVKLVRSTGPGVRSATGHLGPDLCSPDPDLAEAVDRFELRGRAAPLVDVLLDQRICCGVGNVYKSEVLFACRLHPLTPVGSVDEAGRSRLVATAHDQLRRNLEPRARGGRVTTDRVPGGLAVYGRGGLPCVACGELISSGRLGQHHRATYWCPRCQPAPPIEQGRPPSSLS